MPARPAISPSLVCENVDKTHDYFTTVLGFGSNGRMPGPDGQTMYADAFLPTKNGEAHVMFGPKSMAASPESGDFGRNLSKGPLGNGVSIYFNVADVDKYFAFVKGKGAIIDEAPKDQFWGDRTISVLTPDGYYLTFASPIKGHKWDPAMIESVTGKVKATATGTGSALVKKPVKAAPARKGKKAKARAGKGRRR